MHVEALISPYSTKPQASISPPLYNPCTHYQCLQAARMALYSDLLILRRPCFKIITSSIFTLVDPFIKLPWYSLASGCVLTTSRYCVRSVGRGGFECSSSIYPYTVPSTPPPSVADRAPSWGWVGLYFKIPLNFQFCYATHFSMHLPISAFVC